MREIGEVLLHFCRDNDQTSEFLVVNPGSDVSLFATGTSQLLQNALQHFHFSTSFSVTSVGLLTDIPDILA